MKSIHVLAGVTALVAATSAQADFLFGDLPGSYVLNASVSDFSGDDSFNWAGVLVETDLFSDSDNADSPGAWTSSGSAVLATITPTLIDLRGFTQGYTAIESAHIDAFVSVSLTFSVASARTVSWDYSFLFSDHESPAGFVSLNGPDGLVPTGIVSLTPGVYTITANAGYDDFVTAGGDDHVARFTLTLEQIPAPGALTLFGVAGILTRSRRR